MQFFGQALRDGTSGDAPRLRVPDQPRLAASGHQADFRELRRFPRPRFAADDDDLIGLHGFHEFVAALGNRKSRHQRKRRNRRAGFRKRPLLRGRIPRRFTGGLFHLSRHAAGKGLRFCARLHRGTAFRRCEKRFLGQGLHRRHRDGGRCFLQRFDGWLKRLRGLFHRFFHHLTQGIKRSARRSFGHGTQLKQTKEKRKTQTARGVCVYNRDHLRRAPQKARLPRF